MTLEGTVESRRVDREALELAEDVREPEADEANVVILDEGLYVVGGLAGQLATPSGMVGAGRARPGDPRPRSGPEPAGPGS